MPGETDEEGFARLVNEGISRMKMDQIMQKASRPIPSN